MSIESNLNNQLEDLLNEGRNEMLERKQAILFAINSQVMEAKKDVHRHINQLAKIQSSLTKTPTH
ncbi:MAG: hypothetical protein KZQ64_16595 [gamma proteobacterium symbiont of Bathyaustriella thionipta]|nr:hypothetical protein [gamma proteobacterium symbiont of Bathyaustriella thionipta]MCU7948778.1 hypothetical protein [gamma proteobacterium symbiont of Bathyaustriella thionipta]MCU7954985.1 hypothetical protein [gamma proteobacterium symbiont of Bathyaustriella thionipta]MCU7955313.1 hypothetical protein [gamma proteobacterium symbiont of Bathyaustriella thionipta]MCU7967070.1 hypothetical protein [gamma proteobacterium symbiont of Bathyaustriella thionipta]